MSVEKRDFVIERLERQLQDKDKEFEELKVTLRDSIMTELRRDLQNDLNMNNRLTKMEQKISELSNTLNGMMDELLDQKSELRSARNMVGQKNSNSIIRKEGAMPAVFNTVPKPVTQPHISNASIRPSASENPVTSQPDHATPHKAHRAKFNIRNAKKEISEPKDPEPEPKTEYIIADSGDIPHKHRIQNSQHPPKSNRSEYIIADSGDIPHKHRIQNSQHSPKSNRSEYIIAKEKKDVRQESKTEHGFETIEKRDSEDVVITTNRKKSGF